MKLYVQCKKFVGKVPQKDLVQWFLLIGFPQFAGQYSKRVDRDWGVLECGDGRGEFFLAMRYGLKFEGASVHVAAWKPKPRNSVGLQ